MNSEDGQVYSVCILQFSCFTKYNLTLITTLYLWMLQKSKPRASKSTVINKCIDCILLHEIVYCILMFAYPCFYLIKTVNRIFDKVLNLKILSFLIFH